jgi:hypothetical protein
MANFSTVRNVELIYNLNGEGRTGILKSDLAELMGDMAIKEVPDHAEIVMDIKNRQIKVTWLESISAE